MYSNKDQRQLFDLSKALLNSSEASLPLEQRAADLRKVIQYHEWRYYILNDPVLSDYEYDQLFKSLEVLETENPNLVTIDSPTARVSSDLTSNFNSVSHLTPMLSLGNSYNEADLVDFDAQIRRLHKYDENVKITYTVEPKFDGGSIALIFEDDVLVRAATRGNGVQGDDITNNIRTLKSIPLRANFSSFGISRIELRGEAIIRKDIFKTINENRSKKGLSVFANPRNTATGGLRTKDPQDTASRNIEAFIYQMSYAQTQDGSIYTPTSDSHFGTIDMLDNLGFKVPQKERKLCQNINEVVDFCDYWQAQRETYPYEIDGMVVKVDSLELQQKSGNTSHHPRWAIAFKFKAKQATTRLLEVEYQIGKIGSITPVAKVEPVQLAGVKVSSISLHNQDFITSKDIRLGDQVLIERAGDVIPYIVKSLPDLRTGSENIIDFPSTCPVCATTLIRKEGEAAWRCPNTHCEAQVIQRLIHHVSKDAMNIDGFGKAYVERFFEMGWLKTMADIYRIDYDQMALLEGFGEKSAKKLEAAIEVAKKNPISRVLYSLTIHHLGKRVASILAAEIDHVMDLKDWTLEQFTNIKDVGPVVAENIIEYFQEESHLEVISEMEALGVNMNQLESDRPKVIRENAPFLNKSILFTGSLQTMGRKEAQRLAEEAGARNISAVSSKLDVLVVGENAGSKLKKAQAVGTIRILTEEEFLEEIKP